MFLSLEQALPFSDALKLMSYLKEWSMVPSKVKECFDITFCYYANHHYSNVHNIMSLHASFLNFCSHRILQAGFFILDCDVTSPVYVSSVGSAKCFSCLLKLHFPSLYHIILHIPSVLNEV